MRTPALTLLAALSLAGTAQATPPPRYATPSSASVTHARSVLHYYGLGCFRVAPRQWICPLPYPRKP